MPISTSMANEILKFLFAKSNTLTSLAPSSVYIGLSSNDPEADGGTFTELSGGGYGRVLISVKGETYPNVIGDISNRKVTNTHQINWNKATSNWLDAKGFGLFTSSTGGQPFYYGKLGTTLSVPSGAVALFDPGTLEIGISSTDETI